eukprot:7166171-Pyramimonas_sp.AAC.1
MSDSKWVEILGAVGGFILSSMLVPQVRKVYRTQSAKDLSWIFLGQYFVGLTLLLTYAWSKNLWSLYVPQMFEISMLICQSVMKYVYDQRAAQCNVDNKENDVASSDNPFKAQTAGQAERNPMYNNIQ